MSIPPFVISLVTKLPPSMQEKLQTFIMKAIEDKYAVALATVPAAFYLAYFPHFVKFYIMLYNKGLGYNNEAPRSENVGQYKVLPGVMERGRAAHLNSLEMFPFFGIAVIIARIQNVDPQPLTKLCVQYLAYRLCYVFFYLFGVNKAIALLRTLSWAGCLTTAGNIAFLGL